MAVNTQDTTLWSITVAEIQKAVNNSSLVLAEQVIERGYQKIYNITSNCADQSENLKCLYLYLFLLQNYQQNNLSIITEEVMISLLTNIEQISKSCCNAL